MQSGGTIVPAACVSFIVNFQGRVEEDEYEYSDDFCWRKRNKDGRGSAEAVSRDQR